MKYQTIPQLFMYNVTIAKVIFFSHLKITDYVHLGSYVFQQKHHVYSISLLVLEQFLLECH